jgi:hypothetical protein
MGNELDELLGRVTRLPLGNVGRNGDGCPSHLRHQAKLLARHSLPLATRYSPLFFSSRSPLVRRSEKSGRTGLAHTFRCAFNTFCQVRRP